MSCVSVQPVSRGGVVAGGHRPPLLSLRALDARRVEDHERALVIFMCAYASEVPARRASRPCTDADARRFARACLIPGELLERPGLDVARAARALQLPARARPPRARLQLAGADRLRARSRSLEAVGGGQSPLGAEVDGAPLAPPGCGSQTHGGGVGRRADPLYEPSEGKDRVRSSSGGEPDAAGGDGERQPGEATGSHARRPRARRPVSSLPSPDLWVVALHFE